MVTVHYNLPMTTVYISYQCSLECLCSAHSVLTGQENFEKHAIYKQLKEVSVGLNLW